MTETLAEAFVNSGLITREQVLDALAVQRSKGGTLDTALLEADLATERQVLDVLEQHYSLESAGRGLIERAGAALAETFPRHYAETYRMAPLRISGGAIHLLVATPPHPRVLERIEKRLKLQPVAVVTLEARLYDAMRKLYGKEPAQRFASLLDILATRPDSPPKTAKTVEPGEPTPAQEPSIGGEISLATTFAEASTAAHRPAVLFEQLLGACTELFQTAVHLKYENGTLVGNNAKRVTGDIAFPLIINDWPDLEVAKTSNGVTQFSLDHTHTEHVLSLESGLPAMAVAIVAHDTLHSVILGIEPFASNAEQEFLKLANIAGARLDEFPQPVAEQDPRDIEPSVRDPLSQNEILDDSETETDKSDTVVAQEEEPGEEIQLEQSQEEEPARAKEELGEEIQLEQSQEEDPARAKEEPDEEIQLEQSQEEDPAAAKEEPGEEIQLEQSQEEEPAAAKEEPGEEIQLEQSQELLSQERLDDFEISTQPVQEPALDSQIEPAPESHSEFEDTDREPSEMSLESEPPPELKEWDTVVEAAALVQTEHSDNQNQVQSNAILLEPPHAGADQVTADPETTNASGSFEIEPAETTLPTGWDEQPTTNALDQAADDRTLVMAPPVVSQLIEESIAQKDEELKPTPQPQELNREAMLTALENDDAKLRNVAIEALLAIGDEADHMVRQRFPGPVPFDPFAAGFNAPPLPQCNGLLAYLDARGKQSVDTVLSHLQSSNPRARFFALYLLHHHAGPEHLDVIARRLYDTQPAIRILSAETMRRHKASPQYAQVFKGLTRQLKVPVLETRVSVVQILGQLRESRAIPILISLLNAGGKELVSTTVSALAVICGQEFGVNAENWQAWWAENQNGNRGNWLATGLLHKNPAIQNLCNTELEIKSGLSMGYDSKLSGSEKKKVAARWENWLIEQQEVDFSI